MEFALLVILLMWASHFRVSLRQTSRYGVDETLASVSPLRVYSNSRLFKFLDTLRTEHFEELKHIPLDLPSPVTWISLSAAAPDLLDILSCDTGGSHLQRDEPARRPWKGGH